MQNWEKKLKAEGKRGRGGACAMLWSFWAFQEAGLDSPCAVTHGFGECNGSPAFLGHLVKLRFKAASGELENLVLPCRRSRFLGRLAASEQEAAREKGAQIEVHWFQIHRSINAFGR